MVTVGVLGILLRAKAGGLIAAVKEPVDRLVTEIQFYVSPELYRQVLRRAGE